MKKILAFSTVFLLLSVSLIFAQKQTGMVEGIVTDSERTPLPGVTMTIKSPGIRTRSITTDINGRYRFPALPPGEYSIEATLPGFKKYTQEKIPVTLETTITVNIRLEMGTIEEEITVIGESPVVDVRTSRLSTNVKREYFDALPKGRSYQDMVYIAPSVQSGRFGQSFSGATGAENQYIIDGLNTTDVEDGVIGTNLTYEFIEEVQTKTGGYEAEFGGALGGVINVITKSGTNEFRGGAVFNYQSDAFYGKPKIGIFGAGAISEFSYYDFGFNFGGPLIKDKLWFFVGTTPSFRTTHYQPENLFTGEKRIFDVDRKSYYFSGKVTAQLSPGQSVTLSSFGDPLREEGGNPGTLRDFDDYVKYAMPKTTGGTYNFVGKYDGIFGENWLVHGLVGYYLNKRSTVYKDPTKVMEIHQQGHLGYPQNYRTGGGGWFEDPTRRKRLQGNFDVTRYLGGHVLKAGFQWTRSYSLRNDHYTGKFYRVYRPAYGYYYERTRTTEGESFTDIFGIFLQDSWAVTDRLNINLGVRAEKQMLHATDTVQWGTITVAGKEWTVKPQDTILNFGFFEQIAPRVGFTYDIIGDGTSKLFGSYGRFFEYFPMDFNTRVFGWERDRQEYYRIDTGEWYRTWVTGAGQPEGFPGDNDPELIKPPYLEEFILGFEKQLWTDWALSIRGVFKRVGRTVEDGSFDGGESYFLFNPGIHFKGSYDTDPWGFPKATRKYRALEILMNKRMSRNYALTVSYTLSRLEGNWPGFGFEEYGQLDPNITAEFDFPEFMYNADGLLPNDRTHQFKFDGVYMFTKGGTLSFLNGLSLGASFRYSTGKPLSKIAPNIWYGPIAFLEKRGSSGRLDNFYQLDLHVGYDVPIAGRYKIGVTADVFNVLNTRIETRRDMNYIRDTYYGFGSQYYGLPLIWPPWSPPAAPDHPEYYNKVINYQDPIRARLAIVFSF